MRFFEKILMVKSCLHAKNQIKWSMILKCWASITIQQNVEKLWIFFSPISLQYICSEWIAFKLIMLSWVCYFLCLMILDCWTSLTFNQSFLVSCIYGHPKALFLLKSLISSINSFISSNTSDAKYLECNQKGPLTECLGPWSKL